METERLRQNSVRLEIIGRRDRLDNLLLREISRAEEATAEGQRLHLRIAVDYSSRDAITRAAAGMVVALSPDRPTSCDLLRPMLAQALTAESGEVDLLIRTGGEKRLSDFLLWESAYAELLFTDRMWPGHRFGCCPGRIQTSGTTLWLCASGHHRFTDGQSAVTMIAPRVRVTLTSTSRSRANLPLPLGKACRLSIQNHCIRCNLLHRL
jgi:Putative undecaprenyl diphosphate synthase